MQRKNSRLITQLLKNCKFIDCSHPLQVGQISHWPGSKTFERCHIMKIQSHGAEKEFYQMGSDNGTHMDAPSHFFKNGATLSQLSLSHFFGEACVIDVQQQVSTNADYQISLEDLQLWERTFDKIPAGAIVCMRSGWSKFFTDSNKYYNRDPVAGKMHFPCFSEQAIDYLLQERDIAGIGVDSLSPDAATTKLFPIHKKLLSKNKYIIENLAIQELPECGALLVALPLNIAGAAEAPTRVVAIVPQECTNN